MMPMMKRRTMMMIMVLTNGLIISSMARHPSVCSPSVSKIIVPPLEKDVKVIDNDDYEDGDDDDNKVANDNILH